MLSVNHLNVYYGASQALRGVSITATQGRITCLLGRNGVGKTTLLRAIVGQVPTRDGSIEWEGKPLGRMSSHERAKRGIAIVPQGREIFAALTVAENLATGLAVHPRRARKIPDEIFDLFPVLASMRGRRGGDLSGGQQQQLAIGRALVMKPRLLLLDEPTEGIQPSIIKDIERVIRLLASRGDMGILLVEQYFDFAKRLADDYAVMSRGEIVMAGTGASLVEAEVKRFLTV